MQAGEKGGCVMARFTSPTYVGDWSQDWAAYCAFSSAVRASADATRSAIVARARRIGADCGLGAEAPFHMAHNASVGAHYGRPWRNVDQSAMRHILWLEKRSWVPTRLADRVIGREWEALMGRGV